MSNLRIWRPGWLFLGALLVWSGDVVAASSTLGATDALQCFQASRLPFSGEGIDACDHAIHGGNLTLRDLAATYSNRGIIYAANGKYARALEDHNKAIELVPNLGEAYINRGNVFYHTRRFEKALADYEKAISLEAVPAETSWYNKALTLMKLKRQPEAKAAMEHALQLAPNSQKIKEHLAQLSEM